MPVLAAWMPMSEANRADLPAMMSSGISWKALDPTEFCTVTAATRHGGVQAQQGEGAHVGLDAGTATGIGPAIVITRSGVCPAGSQRNNFMSPR